MNFRKILGLDEVLSINTWRAVLAEILVSCLFIIIVCGAGLNIGNTNPSILHISITTGFTIAVLASGFWEVSGGHFNPVVSLALTLNGTISCTRLFLYTIAQCLGSLAGSGLLFVFTPEEFRGSLGALSLNSKISPGVGFVIEVILTYQFIWTVLATTDPLRKFADFQAPFAIGMSVMIGLLMGIPYTGAAMNPIRVFGPAVIMNKKEHHWIYWAGPMLGAILAVFTYHFAFKLSVNRESAIPQENGHTESNKNLKMNHNSSNVFHNQGFRDERSYTREENLNLE